MLSFDDLTHTVQLERYRGDDTGVAVYDGPTPIAVYLEVQLVLLETAIAEQLGTETGLSGSLWTNETDLPPGSRITARGRTGYLGAATRYDDDHDLGDGLAHVEAEVTPTPPAAEQRTATVALIDPTGATTQWDTAEEVTRTIPAQPYATDVPASIVEASPATQKDVAEEIVRAAPYLVTLHRDTTPAAGHLVRVTTADDPLLVSRTLRVEHVVRRTGRLQRQVYCALDTDTAG